MGSPTWLANWDHIVKNWEQIKYNRSDRSLRTIFWSFSVLDSQALLNKDTRQIFFYNSKIYFC